MVDGGLKMERDLVEGKRYILDRGVGIKGVLI